MVASVGARFLFREVDGGMNASKFVTRHLTETSFTFLQPRLIRKMKTTIQYLISGDEMFLVAHSNLSRNCQRISSLSSPGTIGLQRLRPTIPTSSTLVQSTPTRGLAHLPGSGSGKTSLLASTQLPFIQTCMSSRS